MYARAAGHTLTWHALGEELAWHRATAAHRDARGGGRAGISSGARTTSSGRGRAAQWPLRAVGSKVEQEARARVLKAHRAHIAASHQRHELAVQQLHASRGVGGVAVVREVALLWATPGNSAQATATSRAAHSPHLLGSPHAPTSGSQQREHAVGEGARAQSSVGRANARPQRRHELPPRRARLPSSPHTHLPKKNMQAMPTARRASVGLRSQEGMSAASAAPTVPKRRHSSPRNRCGRRRRR